MWFFRYRVIIFYSFIVLSIIPLVHFIYLMIYNYNMIKLVGILTGESKKNLSILIIIDSLLMLAIVFSVLNINNIDGTNLVYFNAGIWFILYLASTILKYNKLQNYFSGEYVFYMLLFFPFFHLMKGKRVLELVESTK